MAHTIISHHGLNDWVDDNCDDYFSRRISKNDNYHEVITNISEITDGENVDSLLDSAVKEWLSAAADVSTEDKIEYSFYLGMLERLIQSALIDAEGQILRILCLKVSPHSIRTA